MSRFFIKKPVFASVIAIFIMMLGALSFALMPVSQFPHMTPPSIALIVEYSGASAKTMQDSIAQVIEQRMVGLDDLLYITTNSSAEGRMLMRLTFASGTDPDLAQMQVQNRLQLALPLLPETVKNQGIRVRKIADTFLNFYAFLDTSGTLTSEEIGDFVSSVILDPLCRVDGVGDATLFGSPYAMRIWLDPTKLRSYSLTPSDVVHAVEAQNDQISVGQIGGLPALPGQDLNVTLTSRVKLETIEQFQEIVVHVNADGSVVRVKDVARVEMGLQSYIVSARFNGQAAISVGIQLAEGANAVKTAENVEAFMQRMSAFFPKGLTYQVSYDTVPFIWQSIKNVVRTLCEAIALVACVMALFIQNWRATLIPTLAVPIVLLGTLCSMFAVGSSINTLSMFGLVLAIGLLVDDAIVVVENTERILKSEAVSPLEATVKSMEQITGALIGVAAVLSAVFLPMAFFSGISGAIYREFSITIIASMLLSVFVAIVITPPMCANLLRKKKADHSELRFFQLFNHCFVRGAETFLLLERKLLAHKVFGFFLYALLVLVTVWALLTMPTSFLPVEDQGQLNFTIFMPAGTSRESSTRVVQEVESFFLKEEANLIRAVSTTLGLGPYGSRGQNVVSGYVKLALWEDRPHASQSAWALVERARKRFGNHPEARIVFFMPPQVTGLGQASGISLQLEDQGSLGYEALVAAREELLAKGRQSPLLSNIRTSSLDDVPQLRLDIDDLKIGVFSLNPASVNSDLTAALGGLYVNDFVDRGRIKRVYVQGDAPFRMNTDDLNRWYFRNTLGRMVPLEAFAKLSWSYGPSQLERFNGVQSTIIETSPAVGVSSGTAMDELERLVSELPEGIGLEWTGLSYQEKQSGGKTGILYALSIVTVFLCLAALYESWIIPFAVILIVPIGVLGAVACSSLRGLYNDIYFQVGILAVIGLSAKNAILIVEFAKTLVSQGMSYADAAIEAARLRLRPILMTSLAFMLGVLPLAISHGAGANSQHAIGTGILGGTFLATSIGIFFIPLFFVSICEVFMRKKKPAQKTTAQRT
ncbi:MAG: efflux RND transporter permease subunit [Desulfovibrionaceae bacterium]|nr:efflux RND transporter permease subunit [Desulfovibrionaceae bacterium]